ncbi:phosphoribosylformylglycinamidine synthase subunit PurL [candidate division KSB1 bacterium]
MKHQDNLLGNNSLLPFSGTGKPELKKLLQERRLNLSVFEAGRIVELLGRNPSLVEATIFHIMWSEHCSYKSSKKILKKHLPIQAPNVILSVEEDAGIVELGTVAGRPWGLVVAHESHNHPSQVVPMEGAATGIGGIIRDVYCMGAEVVGVMDALRFGDPLGPNRQRVTEVVQGVVDGIWRYGNPVGLPNLGGDVLFDSTYDDNCLVNVVAIGVVPADRIIHSYVPATAADEPYDVILVGKPTDDSGFGGAAFASVILDDADELENRGAVQVPDPFLKRVLSEAIKVVLNETEAAGFQIGFKDLGAGGIACSTSEMGAAAGFGIELDLDLVPVSMDIPPEIIACSETQERYCLIVPRRFSPRLLDIFNKDFELPSIYEGARAAVIGSVADHGRYVLRRGGEVVTDADIDAITTGIFYDRETKPRDRSFAEPAAFPQIAVGQALLEILASPNGTSREYIYRHYDSQVMGNAVMEAGAADAGVISPFSGEPVGIAVSADGNPFYGEIDPYQAAALAVAESMMNVAAVGATPACLTDCLNFGNPEDPAVMSDFTESVKGIAWAAREIGHIDHPGHPVPVVSGNVSFYNESARGRAIHPSPIICCVGLIDDYSKAVSMDIKGPGNRLVLIGPRRDELGGSIFYRLFAGETGANIPRMDPAEIRAMIAAVIEAVNSGLVLACHDISTGGLLTSLAEMMLACPTENHLGIDLEPESGPDEIAASKYLFSETPGYILEVRTDQMDRLAHLLQSHGLVPEGIGHTTSGGCLRWKLSSTHGGHLDLAELRKSYDNGMVRILRGEP